MKVHCQQIPEGETLHIEGEDNAAALGLEEAGACACSPLSYSLDVGLSEGGLFATGSLSVRVRQRCVACLEEFEQDIEVNDFALQTELTGNELLDLTPFVREDIHLVLPPYPKCDTGGGKTCPATFPGAPSAGLRQPENSASAWDALDKLTPPPH